MVRVSEGTCYQELTVIVFVLSCYLLFAIQEIMNGKNTAQSNAFATKKKKRMSVERIYQKKTQLEHILLRPDTYIGSVEPIKQGMWVYDEQQSAIVSKEITYVPGLYKIFDEILGEQSLLFVLQYLLAKSIVAFRHKLVENKYTL